MHFFFQGSSSMAQLVQNAAAIGFWRVQKIQTNKKTESYHTNSTFLTLVASAL